jgi:hypothetical protein
LLVVVVLVEVGGVGVAVEDLKVFDGVVALS